MRRIKLLPLITALVLVPCMTSCQNNEQDNEKFVVQWLNYNDEVLKVDFHQLGDIPVYTGETPSKPANFDYYYEFSNWTPSILAVTQHTVYKAVYTTKSYENKFNLDTSSLVMNLGESYQLSYYINPHLPLEHSVEFRSSDDSALTVDENGLITTKKLGKTKIAAILDNKYYSYCEVSCIELIVEDLPQTVDYYLYPEDKFDPSNYDPQLEEHVSTLEILSATFEIDSSYPTVYSNHFAFQYEIVLKKTMSSNDVFDNRCLHLFGKSKKLLEQDYDFYSFYTSINYKNNFAIGESITLQGYTYFESFYIEKDCFSYYMSLQGTIDLY